jgi:uncharacterized membrane protein
MIPFLSASSSASSSETTVVIFFLIIILIMARRIYRNYTGVRVSPARTLGYTVFYFAFGGFFLIASFSEGVPFYYAIPEGALLILGTFGSYKLADRRISFSKPSATSHDIVYKGGIVIYLIYVIALVARIAIEFIFIGPSALTFTVTTLSQTAILAAAITDVLLSFGIGLLIGRNVRVYQRYRLIVEGKETVAAS